MNRDKAKKFKVIAGPFWFYYYVMSYLKGLKLKEDFSHINNYIFFIGYPRSGHSLIGSLLDAHSDIVISNEMNSLYFFKKKYFRHQIFYFILRNSKRHAAIGRSNSDYSYVVPNQWQGKYRKLIGIGDKKGGKSSSIFGDENHMKLLHNIEKISQAKLKIIHVIRNPYDNVSTMILRQVKKNGKELTEDLFNKRVHKYLELIETNTKLKAHIPNNICDVHLEDFIANPKKELIRIFQFLEIDVSQEYIKDCSSIVWDKTNQSRFDLPYWTTERIQNFSNSIKPYAFLNRYNYE
ncbi:sulfotransferase [Dokdonia sp.]|uniref:sulfotransferase family protein n=1 Tax=Dokdonia sp. TaxID=2024995 RepID=UPI003266F97E